MERCLRIMDAVVDWTGKATALLVALLTVVLSYEVFMRYIFNAPTVWAFDISYMLGGSFFMLGASYALLHQKHVRIDVIYNKFSPKTQALIDTVLWLLLFFPVWIGIFIHAIPYVGKSWTTGERSLESFWRPPIYPLKTVLILGVFLLLMAGTAEFIRTVDRLRKHR